MIGTTQAMIGATQGMISATVAMIWTEESVNGKGAMMATLYPELEVRLPEVRTKRISCYLKEMPDLHNFFMAFL